jgi:hypothetical protein
MQKPRGTARDSQRGFRLAAVNGQFERRRHEGHQPTLRKDFERTSTPPDVTFRTIPVCVPPIFMAKR